jgi:hypothetical protein
MNYCVLVIATISLNSMQMYGMDVSKVYESCASVISYVWGYKELATAYKENNIKKLSAYLEDPWKRKVFDTDLGLLFKQSAEQNKHELVKLFCRYDYAQKMYKDEHDLLIESPLHWHKADVKTIQLLLEGGASPLTWSQYIYEYRLLGRCLNSQKGSTIETPLFPAAREKKMDILGVLLTTAYLDMQMNDYNKKSLQDKATFVLMKTYPRKIYVLPEELFKPCMHVLCRVLSLEEKRNIVQFWKDEKRPEMLNLFCETEFELHLEKVNRYIQWTNIVRKTACQVSCAVAHSDMYYLLCDITVKNRLQNFKETIIAMIKRTFVID